MGVRKPKSGFFVEDTKYSKREGKEENGNCIV
jgi:hypothetical protein